MFGNVNYDSYASGTKDTKTPGLPWYCCNLVSIFSIEPSFYRDIEHVILTNLLLFVFELLHFGGKIMLLISGQKL